MGKLEDAHQNLREATEAYNKAANDEAEARRNATAALNSLNKAQSDFDRVVAELRGQAPRTSHWTANKVRPATDIERAC